MAVLEIRQMGDPVLRAVARPIRKIGSGTRKLLDEMAETMYQANGVGLAGPQVGVSKRIIVVDVGDGLVELINPEIRKAEGEATATEGCLSVGEYVGEVTRPEKVSVTGLDRDGHQVWYDAGGLFARALQHEIDHLNGTLFVDKAIKLVPAEDRQETMETVEI